jgi:prefoldin subunit 5
MFTALFLNSNAKNAERAIEEFKKRVMSLKVEQQTLKGKMQNLNDRIL